MQNMQPSVVSIPAVTLKAIKDMLFGENGTDLSGIINDIAGGLQCDRDLVAINTALVFKGIKPKIDDAPRWRKDWKRAERLTFVSCSLITNMVTVDVEVYVPENGDWAPRKGYDVRRELMPVEFWLEMSTEAPEVPEDK